ncbi:hypothetical protein N8972_02230 [Sulfurospirillum sp.]|nr:hypothetical protein [Sulfurospirillum sp.]
MKVVIFSFLLVCVAFGHKLYILPDDDGKSLHVKSYFTKSSACKNCEVNIYSNKKLIDNGKTDDNGEITFSMRSKDIRIEVIASMGHKNTILYSSENEIVTEDKNITLKKMLMALGVMALIFFILRILKR